MDMTETNKFTADSYVPFKEGMKGVLRGEARVNQQ